MVLFDAFAESDSEGESRRILLKTRQKYLKFNSIILFFSKIYCNLASLGYLPILRMIDPFISIPILAQVHIDSVSKGDETIRLSRNGVCCHRTRSCAHSINIGILRWISIYSTQKNKSVSPAPIVITCMKYSLFIFLNLDYYITMRASNTDSKTVIAKSRKVLICSRSNAKQICIPELHLRPNLQLI